jgi:hypothetical protein
MEHTITRSQLVEVAERTLAHVGVTSGDLRLDVLNVAHTATAIHRDWWDDDAQCGCLIGTLRRRRGERHASPAGRNAEYRIGVRFAIELDELLIGGESLIAIGAVAVIEDAPVPVAEPDRELAVV